MPIRRKTVSSANNFFFVLTKLLEALAAAFALVTSFALVEIFDLGSTVVIDNGANGATTGSSAVGSTSGGGVGFDLVNLLNMVAILKERY